MAEHDEESNAKPVSDSIPIIVDVHTHTYPPSYISLLSARTKVPYIHQPEDGSSPRLIILPSDDDPSIPPSQRGRPLDPSYSSFTAKLSFMHNHNISISVVSLANPWLDFLPPAGALAIAQTINNDLNTACETQNAKNDPRARLYAFACLPLSAPPNEIIAEIHRLTELSCIKGIILGTTGLGAGLDDPRLDPLWAALQETQLMIFLHPHYGLPETAFGGASTLAKSGHVLPLALGFPMETTIAVSRMWLAGVFDRYPELRMLLAHSGGTLPFLAGRLQSCVEHERVFMGGEGPGRTIWEVLSRNVWLDAVVYGSVGVGAAVAAGGDDGWERVMFGTDHPFFPPLEKNADEERWTSVDSNVRGIAEFAGSDERVLRGILGKNAAQTLGIEL